MLVTPASVITAAVLDWLWSLIPGLADEDLDPDPGISLVTNNPSRFLLTILFVTAAALHCCNWHSESLSEKKEQKIAETDDANAPPPSNHHMIFDP